MDEPDFDLRSITALLHRQRRLVVLTITLVLAGAVLALITLKPAYSASVLVLVDPGHKNLLAPDQPGASAASDSARVDGEVEIIRSDATLARVVADLGLMADPQFGTLANPLEQALAFFRWGPPPPDETPAMQEVVERLRDAIAVQRRGATFLILVSARAESPERAAQLANALAETYIALQVAAKAQRILAARDIVRLGIAEAQKAVADAQGTLDRFILASLETVAVAPPHDRLAGLYTLRQTAANARSQYQALLARLQDLETQAYLQVADARIVSPATPPVAPSFPDKRLTLVLAGFSGLGLGIVLAFLHDNFIGGFTTAGQLALMTRTKVIAAIPRQRPPRTDEPLSLADAVIDAPLSVFAEAIRRVRVNIDRLLRGSRPGAGIVVMLTSAAPGEGKTTTAVALARAYAAARKPVLLIDCDLRNPSVHKHLGIERSAGMLDYLSDESDSMALAAILADDPRGGAHVALGGRRSAMATDQLVNGPTFQRLIEAARNSFDVVILDTPPIGSVVDGLYLADYADIAVMVVRWASTSQQEVRTAIAALAQAARPGMEIATVLAQLPEPRPYRRRRDPDDEGSDD